MSVHSVAASAASAAPVSIAAVAAAQPAEVPAVAAAAASVATAGAWESCGGAGNTCTQALIDAGHCKDEAWKVRASYCSVIFTINVNHTLLCELYN
jgi:hypothetical protein